MTPPCFTRSFVKYELIFHEIRRLFREMSVKRLNYLRESSYLSPYLSPYLDECVNATEGNIKLGPRTEVHDAMDKANVILEMQERKRQKMHTEP